MDAVAVRVLHFPVFHTSFFFTLGALAVPSVFQRAASPLSTLRARLAARTRGPHHEPREETAPRRTHRPQLRVRDLRVTSS